MPTLSKQAKIIFITELITNVHQDIMSRIDAMPEEWDGIELRQYIADKFREVVLSGIMSRKQRIEYNNELIVNSKL